MERCPNCSEMVRGGARYCTTCGYRMPGAPGDAPNADVNGDAPAPPTANSWPTYSSSHPESGEEPSSDSTVTAEEASTAASEPAEAVAIASLWPAPPAAPADSQARADDTGESETVAAAVSETVVAVTAAPDESPARERVLALIDEVREFVAAIPNDDRDALRGVVAELDVASTAPGAFDQEELAGLRDALLAARDRPRDLDTVLDLTGRIDSMVALVFAYERSHAAIERALDVLRWEE